MPVMRRKPAYTFRFVYRVKPDHIQHIEEVKSGGLTDALEIFLRGDRKDVEIIRVFRELPYSSIRAADDRYRRRRKNQDGVEVDSHVRG